MRIALPVPAGVAVGAVARLGVGGAALAAAKEQPAAERVERAGVPLRRLLRYAARARRAGGIPARR
ncbi:MAG TPA: hypothetical protein P5181_05745 [Dermatophilaceae bacterium]|nr:hypothetical protein [Dermatophilaceae bacterium]